MASIDRDSAEIRTFRLTATNQAGAAIDVTSDTVNVAFKLSGERPAVGDWKACGRNSDDTELVEVKFNLDGGFELEPGSYRRYVKVGANPETPIVMAEDPLNVT